MSILSIIASIIVCSLLIYWGVANTNDEDAEFDK